ncbi:MAG: DNA alkylation repair protein, partial [Nitrospirae bacterium]
QSHKTGTQRLTRTPLLNAVGQQLGRLLLNDGAHLEGLTALWKEGGRDERLIVVSAIGQISRQEPERAKQFVLEILDDINDWEVCDQLALRVIVNLAVKKRNETFSLLHRWLNSENPWHRRLAVATVPPYIRAKRQEFQICLELLEAVMKDRDRSVKKATAWALRELTKKAPEAVFQFLHRWTLSGDSNTHGIVKEGMKKLPKEKQKSLLEHLKGHK